MVPNLSLNGKCARNSTVVGIQERLRVFIDLKKYRRKLVEEAW
jgi:hypothetical protein